MTTELDITDFFNNAAPMDYSASAAEIGQNAGEDTWRAAVEDSEDYQLLRTDDLREVFRAYVQDFGAWSEEEIAAWNDTELNALCIQFVSGDMREGDLKADSTLEDWARYYRRAEQGQISGRLYKDTDARIYFNISN